MRGIEAVIGHTLLFTANPVDDADERRVWRFSDGATTEPLVTTPGVHSGWGGGTTVVVRSSTLEDERSVVRVLDGPELVNHAEAAPVRPSVTLLRAGERGIATAVLLPNVEHGAPRRTGRCPSSSTPTAGRTPSGWCAPATATPPRSGSPTRASPWSWPTAAAPPAGAASGSGPSTSTSPARCSTTRSRRSTPRPSSTQLDLDRVAIRGWSFGGYLAALAVLRRPDVFHAAVAGAPVTDWRLYDTHYTERYLGDPDLAAGGLRPHLARCAEGVGPVTSTDRCCSSTAWPTTTSWRRTASSCRRRSWPPGGRTRCCRCPASPT